MNSSNTTEKDQLDKSLYWLGIISILMMWMLVYRYLPDLPERIPSHFNFKGEIDAYGSKYMLFILPVIGTITWVVIGYLGNKPQLYNFPVQITESNKETQFYLAQKMMRIMNASTSILFLFIQWILIQSAQEQSSKITSMLLYLMVGWILVITFGYFWMAKKNK